MTALYGSALLSLFIWVWLVFFRDGFWRGRQRLGRPQQDLVGTPSVLALIPARNEEDTIAQVISSIRGQNYPGELGALLVDDQSEDATVARAKAADLFDLRIVRTQPLPAGWSGKMWALEAGWQDIKARGLTPDYIWLNDADIVHEPEVLTALVTKAQARQSALTSLMVRLNTRGFWGALLIPAFVYYFQLLYPFTAVSRRDSKAAGAAGGCILIERVWLEKIGGFEALKGALIDDCTLAKLVQNAGGRLWLGHGTASKSLRDNASLGSIWSMVRRTAYVQLGYNVFLLIGCLLGLLLTFIAPVVAVCAGVLAGEWSLAGVGSVATALMTASYMPTLHLYGQARWQALFLPLVTLLYGAMTIHSAAAHMAGQGNAWKGRAYGSR
ncbi:MAG: glycosyltransferase [Pseudomonadota bacterium]